MRACASKARRASDAAKPARPARTHDFAAFQAAGGTAKTTVRTLEMVRLSQDGCDLTLTVRGNAFLYNMVRIIAGTMLDIGMGRAEPAPLPARLKRATG